MNAVLVKVIFTLLAFIISNPSIPQSVKDQSLALVSQTATDQQIQQPVVSPDVSSSSNEGSGISGVSPVLGGVVPTIVNGKTGATTTTDSVIMQGQIFVRDLPPNLPLGSKAPVPILSGIDADVAQANHLIQYYVVRGSPGNQYLKLIQNVDR